MPELPRSPARPATLAALAALLRGSPVMLVATLQPNDVWKGQLDVQEPG